ncbi:MAG TPA: AAA family ATPase [Terracidiphilus sp.]|nr:AAA family ATPase [Terracidiphilus sp.]
MTDNGSKTHPVRTLTVKNFSVIKEAKLDFGKISVLIGPQASGKSLLCKLAYFLIGEITGLAVDSLLDGNTWDDFLKAVKRGFNERFLTTGWLRTNTEATYSSGQYFVAIWGIGDPINPDVRFSFSDEFEIRYRAIGDNLSKQLPTAIQSRTELRQDLFSKLIALQNPEHRQSNTYIPAGRALFTEASKSIAALQNPDMDQITRRFAGLIAWDSRWKAGYLTTGRKVLPEVEQEMYRIAGGTTVVVGGVPHFLTFDGRHLPFSVVSSGTLELLPLFNVVDQLACFQEDINARTPTEGLDLIIYHSPRVFLEEPEAHVFPKTQYELVRLFVELAKDNVLDFDWVITTHSPYILSAFGNLTKAGQVAQEKPPQSKAVNKIIKQEYWIKPGDFRAYALKPSKTEPGKFETESIVDKKTGQIDGDYLDDVSSEIAKEFTELLELQYGG